MATKLNLSTPPAEIIQTLREEYPKSHRWYIKKRGGDEKRNQLVQDLTNKCKNDHFITPLVPYVPPSGNRWINFEHGVLIPNTVRYSVQTEAVIVYETEGSIGCFYPLADNKGNVAGAFIFPSHFFLRYCDDIRQLDTMEGEQTIVRFLSANLFYKDKVYEKDGQKRIYVRFKGCIGLGYVYSDEPFVAEIRTVITDAMMTPQQLADTEEMRAEYDKKMESLLSPDEKDENYRISKEVKDKIRTILHTIVCQNLFQPKSDDSREYLVEKFAALYAVSIGTAIRMVKADVTLTPDHIDPYLVNRMMRYQEELSVCRLTDNEVMITTHADVVTDILQHIGIKITRSQVLQDILNADSKLASYYSNKLNQNNNMNQNSKTQLTNLLARTGLTKKFKKYAEGIDNNLNRYLESVESIYVISRLIPSIVDIKEREKMVNANKMWIQIVVENGFCNELKSYIEEFGKDNVIKAIHHLIDTDMWQSPEYNKALKVKQASNYDGLLEIPNAVDYLSSIAPEQEEAPAEEPKKEEDEILDFEETETATTPAIENPTEMTNNARHAVGMLLQFFNKAQESINTLNDYWENADEMETMLYQENQNLQKLITKTEHEKEELLESIRVSQQKLHDAEKKAKEQEELAVTARSERAEMARDVDTWRGKYNKAQEELDILKEKAKGDSIPKAKIIPASKFTRKMSIGPKTLDLIMEVLEPCGIIVDLKK